MMDTKGRQIAYQVAYKAAVELISASKAPVTPGGDIATEVEALADALYATLIGSLEGLETQPQAAQPQAAQPQAASSAPLLTSAPCPDCAKSGRTGVLLHNETGTGPEFSCSMRDRRKVGNAWTEVGACSFVEWGNNGKRF